MTLPCECSYQQKLEISLLTFDPVAAFLEIAIPAVCFLCILWLIGRMNFFKQLPFSAGALRIAFFLKAFSGLIIYYLYTAYYPVRQDADTFKYFDDSLILFNAWKESPLDYFQMLFGINCETPYFYENYFNEMNNWVRVYENSLYNDNRLVIRLNAFIRLFSLGNYHVHSLVMSFMAFVGLAGLSAVFFKFVRSRWKVFLAVFLVPSVFFWSSGVLKEGVLLFALGLFVFYFYRILSGKLSLLSAFLLLLFAGVLMVMKAYVFIAFLPAALGWWWAVRSKKVFSPYLFSLVLVILVTLLVGWVVPKYDFVQLMVNKQNDFVRMALTHDIPSTMDMDYLRPTILSVVQAIPEALLNCLTRPWPWELKGLLFIPPFLENLFIVVLLGATFFYRNKLALDQKQFLYFCLTFAILLFAVIGLTTPVLGALVRYKVPALPFLVVALLMLIDVGTKFPQNRFLLWIKSHL